MVNQTILAEVDELGLDRKELKFIEPMPIRHADLLEGRICYKNHFWARYTLTPDEQRDPDIKEIIELNILLSLHAIAAMVNDQTSPGGKDL